VPPLDNTDGFKKILVILKRMHNYYFFLFTDFSKHVLCMKWKSKFCTFSANGQGRILQHYIEHHGHYRRCSGLICIQQDCLKTFQTRAELKNNLKDRTKEGRRIVSKILCDLCTFSEPSDIKKYLSSKNLFANQRGC